MLGMFAYLFCNFLVCCLLTFHENKFVFRIKSVMREVDPKEQLKNVNKIKIVQYKYRPEFIDQLPEDEKNSKFKNNIF